MTQQTMNRDELNALFERQLSIMHMQTEILMLLMAMMRPPEEEEAPSLPDVNEHPVFGKLGS